MVIIPATICFSTSVLIYRHVRSSANRVQTGAATTATGHRSSSRRDISLLRHSVIVFAIFVIGWTPWIIIYIVGYHSHVDFRVRRVFDVTFQLALLLNIIDLFLYNHKVRKYLTGVCLRLCPRSQ